MTDSLPLQPKDRRKQLEDWQKNKKTESIKTVQTVLRETRNNSPIFSRFAVQSRTERQLYTTLRESVPIIDAALCKLSDLSADSKL